MVGFAEAEGLVQLRVEDPLLLFVKGVAGTQDATAGLVDFGGGLVGLGDLVVEAGLDAVGNRRLQGEGVFQAEALAGNGVVTATVAVQVHAPATDERTAHCVFQIDVAVILELLVGQAQAVVIAIVPAQLGQHVGGARIFRVGAGTGQAGGVVAIVGFRFVAIALAQVQQTVEVLHTPGEGAGGQPALVGGAVAGLQAGTDVLAWLDDVIRVEGEITHRAADGAAAVQGRGRAAQDLHALDDFRVDVIAAGLGVRAVEEIVRHFDAIHLGEDAVAVDATNVVARVTRARTGAADGDAGFVAHQFTDVVDVLAVQFCAVVHADGARYAVHILFIASGADGHLLQGEGAAGATFFQHDVVGAQFAIAQVGPHQQPVQGFFRWQRAAHARGRYALAQFGRQAYLPAGHCGESVECRHQWLLFDAERVIGVAASGRFRGGGAHDGRTSQQDRGGQQGQNGRSRPAVETRGHRERSGIRIL